MCNATGRDHPAVAALLDIFMWPFRRVRRAVIPRARGRVLEIGVGTGLNFAHYRDIDALWGVEPDPHMLKRAAKRTRRVPSPTELIAARAEELPFPSAHFDTVVATWVLCTISDPEAALGEALRVLRPGGRLLFAEHTRSRFLFASRVQSLLTPLWRHLAGGCHLDRDAISIIRQTGFRDVQVRPFGREGWTLSPVYGGEATKRRTNRWHLLRR